MIGLGAIAGDVERHRAPQTYFVDHFNVWRRCVEGEGCQDSKNRIGEVDAGTTACTFKLQLDDSVDLRCQEERGWKGEKGRNARDKSQQIPLH